MIKITDSSTQSGKKYSSLMLTGKSYINDKWQRFVECICDCGEIVWKYFSNVKRGHTKSCGCLHGKTMTKHGMAIRDEKKHPIYMAWINIKTRCHQIDGRDYPEYGGRGIIVCDEWRYNFKTFYDWCINNGWREGLQLDRYPNNDGNYEPENCRFATSAQQNRNKRNNILVTAFGETKCLMDWALDKRAVVEFKTIRHRMVVLKWDGESAITHPSSDRSKRKDNIAIMYNNKIKRLFDWCDELGLDYKLMWSRLKNGWDVKKAFETALVLSKSHKK